ncbi:MAG TPA: C40 family peptidase [Streptosporangiaceae bacterium]|nr:C40 family peptidase [Streptosporangiaceae bacterium]
MSRMLLERRERREVGVTSKRDSRSRLVWLAVVGGSGLVMLALLAVPFIVGSDMFFASTAGCSGQKTGTVGQPPASGHAGTIPADYLHWYQVVGQQYNVPWPVLAGIGTVESDNGRSTLPGVHQGANPFGAAGPMQIGIGGAAGNVWGGAAVHADSVMVSGVATDEDGLGVASVYDPADAIAGAAKYLVRAGVQTDVPAAIFAYNHLQSYVQSVLYWAGVYAGGKFGVVQASTYVAGCGAGGPSFTVNAPNQAVATAIAFAEGQLGKPYLWGGTGPDAFDCSGLVMMAYRAAGVDVPRTSQNQWLYGPRVPAASVEPGDLVFFAGADGTRQAPGHVGLVIGNGQMIEAFAQGVPIRISSYAGSNPVGFTRPWAKAASATPSPPP